MNTHPWIPSPEDAARIRQLALWLHCSEADLREAITRRWATLLDNCGIDTQSLDLHVSPHDLLVTLYAERA